MRLCLQVRVTDEDILASTCADMGTLTHVFTGLMTPLTHKGCPMEELAKKPEVTEYASRPSYLGR